MPPPWLQIVVKAWTVPLYAAVPVGVNAITVRRESKGYVTATAAKPVGTGRNCSGTRTNIHHNQAVYGATHIMIGICRV